MKKNLIWRVELLLLSVALGASACNTTTTTVAAKNVTQPVLLGPVRHIKGDKPLTLAKKDEFDIKVQQSYEQQSNGRYATTSTVIQEGEEKVDAELLKKVEGPAEKIVVDNVYVNSSISCFLISCTSWIDYSGIEGGIYGKDSAAGVKK